MKNQKRKEILTLLIVFAGVVLLSAAVVYFLSGGNSQRATTTTPQVNRPAQQQQQPDAVLGMPERTSTTPTTQVGGDTFIDRLFGSRHSEAYLAGDTWLETMGRISLRFLLAAVLGAALAFRPRKRILALKRNPYVSQTQILLAIVA